MTTVTKCRSKSRLDQTESEKLITGSRVQSLPLASYFKSAYFQRLDVKRVRELLGVNPVMSVLIYVLRTWTLAFLPMVCSFKFQFDQSFFRQVIFEAVRGRTYHGDISIDDISFSPGCYVSEGEGNCFVLILTLASVI